MIFMDFSLPGTCPPERDLQVLVVLSSLKAGEGSQRINLSAELIG
jgi:hypothetical protein